MRTAILTAGAMMLTMTMARADVTNIHIIYNLQLRSSLNHFKEDCRLAKTLIRVGQEIGEDGTARARAIVDQALASLGDALDFDKLDQDVVFKSFLGSQGRRTLIVAGQKVYWVRKDNHDIKEYLVEATKLMRRKLFAHANGDRSARFNALFEELDVLERLTGSILATFDVKRNRKGEETDRRPRPEVPADAADGADDGSEPPVAVEPAPPAAE